MNFKIIWNSEGHRSQSCLFANQTTKYHLEQSLLRSGIVISGDHENINTGHRL